METVNTVITVLTVLNISYGFEPVYTVDAIGTATLMSGRPACQNGRDPTKWVRCSTWRMRIAMGRVTSYTIKHPMSLRSTTGR